MSALVYSRERGYVSPQPGDICTMQALGQHLRVRVTDVVCHGMGPGKVRVRCIAPEAQGPRPSGWERFGGRPFVVRAGRLQMIDPPP